MSSTFKLVIAFVAAIVGLVLLWWLLVYQFEILLFVFLAIAVVVWLRQLYVKAHTKS